MAYTPDMYPIFYRWLFFIYTYTVLLVLGMAAAIGLTAWLARRTPTPHWLDALLLTLLGAVVGGRIGFVWTHWDYFAQNSAEIWQIWLGGLSYHGALLAGLATLALWCAVTKRPFFDYAGLFAPGLALGSAFGWLACFAEGCGYGRETFLGWISADLPDEFGVFAVRYQTQLLGVVLTLAVTLLAIWLLRHWPRSAVFWATLGLLSLSHLLIGLLRGDPAPTLANQRLDVWLDAALALVSLVATMGAVWRDRERR